MRFSIGLRVVLLVNLLILGAGAAIGYLSADVAGGVIEGYLFREMVRNTGTFLRERRLPFGDSMMGYLSRMYGLDAVAVNARSGKIIGSSLAPAAAEEFGRKVQGLGVPGSLRLGESDYQVESFQLLHEPREGGAGEPVKLFLLVPRQRLADARHKAVEQIMRLTLPVMVVATILASLVALTMTRPIRRLSAHMDHLGGAASESDDALPPELVRRGPTEVVRLAESFQALLGRLRAAQQQLAQAGRLATLGQLSASVAHELKNPLSGIKMNVRVLEDEVAADPALREEFQRIYREIDRMDLYLQELMDLAAGNAPLDKEPPDARADLAAVADSVLQLLSGRCRHANVRVEREFTLVPPVQASPQRIRQVILNLVINAVESLAGSGRVRLVLAPAGEGRVRFSVCDSGKGVDVPAGTDIFEPFVSTKQGGAGLGLYICKQIVTRCGGRIGCESSLHGATFWFELPAAEVAPAASGR